MALSISFELISLFIIKFELNVLMKISAMTPKKLGRERERERWKHVPIIQSSHYCGGIFPDQINQVEVLFARSFKFPL